MFFGIRTVKIAREPIPGIFSQLRTVISLSSAIQQHHHNYPQIHTFKSINSNPLTSVNYSMECNCRNIGEDIPSSSFSDRHSQESLVTATILPLRNEALLFDAHCHLQLAPLREFSRQAVTIAGRHGVDKIAVCGTSPGDDWNYVLDLWQTHENIIIPSLGLHPWWIARVMNTEKVNMIPGEVRKGESAGMVETAQEEARGDEIWANRLEEMLLGCPYAHVGECGLDKAVVNEGVSMELQERILVRHLKIAAQYGRTITLHCVSGCWERLIAILKQFESDHKDKVTGPGAVAGAAPLCAIILHSCNSLPHHLLSQLLRLRSAVFFSISAGGRGGITTRTVTLIHAIPADRLLIETDSPDQMPACLRNNKSKKDECHSVCLQYNEPALLLYHCTALAEALQLNPVVLANRTRRNAFAAFQLAL